MLKGKLSNIGLDQIAELSFDWNHKPSLLLKLFKYSWYKTLIDHAYKTRKSITHFDRVGHEKDILEKHSIDKWYWECNNCFR